MTKNELKVLGLGLLKEHKANKELTKAITELLESYIARTSKDKIERFITVEGVDYQWCNRHIQYEVVINFTGPKQPCCKLAHQKWLKLSKAMKEANEDLMKAALAGDDTKDLAKVLVKAKEVRGGSYNYSDDMEEFGEIEKYLYTGVYKPE